MLALRNYQERSLGTLGAYLARAAREEAGTAFMATTGRPYISVPQLADLPYVCLRIPTGGGKTLMASHALGIAARTYLQAERAVCLWLVPTNAIREQTLLALRNRAHPYRQALDARFDSQVSVMDLTEALSIQRGVLDGETVVIVATLAALRVEDTEGRKVYESAGTLAHHFVGLPAPLEAVLERTPEGVVPCSLANVLRLRCPVVIMDEAHNARTPLSFDVLARFSPSCVIEFTATPETEHNPGRGKYPSNVLCHVSAAELKAEEMVKLPIKLTTRENWKEVVGDAVQKQQALESVAREEEGETRDYIRPIVLLQAQPRRQAGSPLTVEVVQQCLQEDFRIPEEQIAVATGDVRGIEDINLLDRGCPIRFIITVQALREGWDCSFAYILCTVAEVSSTQAVEQVLGRILRLPGARWKRRGDLNCAYAFVASPRFLEAAMSLKDALVENGFERFEAAGLVVPQEGTASLPLFAPVSVQVSTPPDLSRLEPGLRERVAYETRTRELTVVGGLSGPEAAALQNCFRGAEDRRAVEELGRRAGVVARASESPAQRGEEFKVPWLAIRSDGQLELLDVGRFLEADWNLAACDPTLTEAEFPPRHAAGTTGRIDTTSEGRLQVDQIHEQLALLEEEPGWPVEKLAAWLDRQVPHPDVPQAVSMLFIHNVLRRLMEHRGLSVEQTARQKFRLRDAIEAKIELHRQAARKQGYQALLFGSGAGAVEVSPEVCFSYTEDHYDPNSLYAGAYDFQKHYFHRVGDLKGEGEEFTCAAFLDRLPEVKFWVRNLERRPDASFWLPTSTDRFYPDFVARLNDGRILVVEYKRELDWTNDDSKEKRAVGDLWAERSGGRGLFVMPRGQNFGEITAAIGSAPVAATRAEPFRRVAGAPAERFRTCLPLYGLKAAATAFGREPVGDPDEPEAWVEPEGRTKPGPGLFLAQVVGESMSRRIPDGAYCVFRKYEGGTREGKVVLVQSRDIQDEDHGGQYTVKVYQSDKVPDGEESWRHAEIRLNPDSKDSRYRPIVRHGDSARALNVIAELVEVLGAK